MSDYVPPGYASQPIVTSTAVDPSEAKGKKKGSGKQGVPTRRSTSTAKFLFLAFGLVLALILVLILTSRQQTTYVVKVTSDLPALVDVQSGSLTAIALPEEAIEPNSFTGASGEEALAKALDYAEGKWLVWPMSQGQQLRIESFSSIGEIAVPLAPDERLISVGAKAARSVAGAVRPGDRIDVYVSEEGGLTGLLRANVEVIGVSITPEQLESASQAQAENPDVSLSGVVPPEPIPGTYILRVKAADVPSFVTADTAGQLFLALRGRDATDTTTEPADIKEAICAAWPASEACIRAGQ